ncbi:MAG TPA: response regulator, partial [Lysobacter sp.]|nr:response regulator [Lysobacter sp.]
LGSVLALPGYRGLEDTRHVAMVFLEAGGERLALAVDEILDEQEVLVRRIEPPLLRVRNIAGATVTAAGRIVPILNAADLLKTTRQCRSWSRCVAAPATRPAKGHRARILVAEDSITSRLLLKGILESAGYDVATAVDGIDAFTTLRSQPFDLLVSDIDMPRLGGFDLTARIRGDSVLAQLPVVLVTALARPEDRERGIDVGANAYIAKGSFDQRDLLETVRRLVALEAA